MLTHLEFRSGLFPAYEGEEEQINPGIFGKRLAEFIVRGLRSEGFACEDPGNEDWGWHIEVENPGFRLWIGCACLGPDGDFLVFIEPHKAFVWRLWRPFHRFETVSAVSRLQVTLDTIFTEESGILDKGWFAHESTTAPGRPAKGREPGRRAIRGRRRIRCGFW